MQVSGNLLESGLVSNLHEQAIPIYKMQPTGESPSFSVPVRRHQAKSVFVVFDDIVGHFDPQYDFIRRIVVDSVGHQQFHWVLEAPTR